MKQIKSGIIIEIRFKRYRYASRQDRYRVVSNFNNLNLNDDNCLPDDNDTKWCKYKLKLYISTKIVSLVFSIYITVTFDVAANDPCQGINSQID